MLSPTCLLCCTMNESEAFCKPYTWCINHVGGDLLRKWDKSIISALLPSSLCSFLISPHASSSNNIWQRHSKFHCKCGYLTHRVKEGKSFSVCRGKTMHTLHTYSTCQLKQNRNVSTVQPGREDYPSLCQFNWNSWELNPSESNWISAAIWRLSSELQRKQQACLWRLILCSHHFY